MRANAACNSRGPLTLGFSAENSEHFANMSVAGGQPIRSELKVERTRCWQFRAYNRQRQRRRQRRLDEACEPIECEQRERRPLKRRLV